MTDAEYQWRESDIYSVALDTGAIRQLTTRRGPDGSPQVSPDGKRVAYVGNDFSKDTWQDSKLYVMNIDGTGHRLVSGDWDRSPQSVTWKEDGNGLYFTAQDQGSQNLYLIPMAGARADAVPLELRAHAAVSAVLVRQVQTARRRDDDGGAAVVTNAAIGQLGDRAIAQLNCPIAQIPN